MKAIIVTGSVGTGKTTLSKRLSKKLNFAYVDVKRLIEKNRLYDGCDKKRKCKIVDTKKLNDFLIKLVKDSNKGIVIDSHMSHYLPKKYVDLCIVTKCDLKILEKRLKKRGYHKDKIRENLDCEIFDVCLNEARERKHKIKIVDTTNDTNINKIKLK
jgi:adenylate kinase